MVDKIQQNKIYSTLGSSNHTNKDRNQNDFYATDPKAIGQLLELEEFDNNIWEPATGMGHIALYLKDKGYNVKMSDLYDYGVESCESDVDFLKCNEKFNGDIITNPPYNIAMEFVTHSLKLIPEGNKVAMFLKIQFLETDKRYKNIFKDNPPKVVYVSVKRHVCKSDGDFTKDLASAVCYCWFVWEKGYKGEPVIRWFNYNEENENSLW